MSGLLVRSIYCKFQNPNPIATILGLVDLFNFNNLNDPLNSELILKLEITTHKFDAIIHDIVSQTSDLEALVLKCKQNRNLCINSPTVECPSHNSCFVEHKNI